MTLKGLLKRLKPGWPRSGAFRAFRLSRKPAGPLDPRHNLRRLVK